MRTSRARFAVATGFLGLSVAVLMFEVPAARAESPLEFFTNQARRAEEPVFTREPVQVPSRQRKFGSLFDFDAMEKKKKAVRPRQAPAPSPSRSPSSSQSPSKTQSTSKASSPSKTPSPSKSQSQGQSQAQIQIPDYGRPEDFQRVVCRRTCDGKEIALGILPERKNHADAAAMCSAAGQGDPTELMVSPFEPGSGFIPRTAFLPPLEEGRAALESSATTLMTAVPAPAPVSTPAPPPAPVCANSQQTEAFMVPLLHDATLRSGDIVATADGWKVFVGRGDPPFKEKDFVARDVRRLPAELRKLQIATY